jgi:tetratricopeptide (TPR) repeat protein
LYRFVLFALLATALAAYAAPAETGQLDASPSLFTVMAAINAAGYDADLNSPNGHPIRLAIRQELAKRNIPSLEAIKEFVAKHKAPNDTAELSQYISFALSCTGPPNFDFKQRDVDIPPDVSGLTGLSPLLAAFYKEAAIDDLWKRSQRAVDQYVERYHQPVVDAVLQVNSYLRQPTSGVHGRHFQIFIELQGAPNQIQTRSYGNEYTIVVTPSTEVKAFDIRHGYLHYSLDPLATRAREILERKKPISDHATRAPALEERYKEDFLLLVSESLIKAVEARLDKKPEMATQALRQGYILTPYFSEQLPVYEKQEAAMLLYFKDMAASIDLKREDARLSVVTFDRDAPTRTVKTVAAPAPEPALSGVAKTLDDAEKLYTSKDYDKAKSTWLAALQQNGDKPQQAAAYYGLARVAALQRDPETAERLFQKTLELEPEAQIKAWSLVYLGNLELAAGGPDEEPEARKQRLAEAGKYFQQALQVQGASDLARQKAHQGIQLTAK